MGKQNLCDNIYWCINLHKSYGMYGFVLHFYRELLPVEKNRNGTKIFSMDQYRGMFHCSREPGKQRDVMDCCFKTGLYEQKTL